MADWLRRRDTGSDLADSRATALPTNSLSDVSVQLSHIRTIFAVNPPSVRQLQGEYEKVQ